jgi:AraC-like DNA-binding protein
MGAAEHTFYQLGRITTARDWELSSHSHTGHEMVLITAGQMETRIRGLTQVCGPGAVKLHPRGEAHAERAVGGDGVGLMCLSWDSAEGVDYRAWPLFVADRTGRIRMLMEWMLELSPPLDAAAAAARHGLLQALVLAYAASSRSPADELVVSIRGWVRTHIARPIYLDDLARVAGVSRYHFNRQFRRAAGMPPMRFVRELRVDAARAHLLNTDLPLREIAPLVGFADEFQLSRVFREVSGHPPAAVRRARA